MASSPPPIPGPSLVKALREVREILHRAVHKGGDVREVESAIERINYALDREGRKGPDSHSQQP